MTDDRSLREKVADAARATAEIRRHIERLTNEAFAAAKQQVHRKPKPMRKNAN
jgi:hemerythrin-like domain-containing protein